MKILTTVLIIFSFICFEKSLQINENETSLVLLQVMLRHGVRTIVNNFPNDINQNFWDKFEIGDMLPKGMKQVEDVGNFYAKKYASFLGKVYNSTRVYARSSDYDRTLSTSSIFLSSLYKPSSVQHWTDTRGLSKWMPIPIHTTEKTTDTVLHMDYICPRRNQLEKLTESSPEYLRVQNENQDFFDQISNSSGFKWDFSNIWMLQDKYLVQNSIGLPSEKYILDNLDKILYLGDYSNDVYFSFEYAKLNSGGLLNDAVKNIKDKIAGSSNQLFFYGVHNYILIGIEKLLSTTANLGQLQYVSSFTFELRMDQKGSYYIQILFKNNKPSEPIELKPVTVKGCETLCPLEKFLSLVNGGIVTDLATDCKIKSS